MTRFTHSSCTGIRASGRPKAAVRKILQGGEGRRREGKKEERERRKGGEGKRKGGEGEGGRGLEGRGRGRER